MSSLYYALFHTLAAKFANTLIGHAPHGGLERAWVEVYRSLDHKGCEIACGMIGARPFPDPIRELAQDMLQLYQARLSADYDPTYTIDIIRLHQHIGTAERHIQTLEGAAERDIKALATFMLLQSAGAKAARRIDPPNRA